MYVKNIQLKNCGPIEDLSLTFPLAQDRPQPVVLVGPNGSGKSIVLSHIVNGLLSAQAAAFPDTPEVESGKVYKVRSPTYITSGADFSFAKVTYDNDLIVGELITRRRKCDYERPPADLPPGDALAWWSQVPDRENSHYHSTIDGRNREPLTELFQTNCVLYFPPNRFEEPAWLNEQHLHATVQYMESNSFAGSTTRRVINYSPLRDNQDWFFGIAYDMATSEHTVRSVPWPPDEPTRTIRVSHGYIGHATNIYVAAQQIIQTILRQTADVKLKIGSRRQRVCSVVNNDGVLVPNVFQLSSGETALVNLSFSILRDFELSGATFRSLDDIRGVVIVDEIDLHLHPVHQHEVLPQLLRLFPNVQFVLTTHAPLVVLGMREAYGEDGFLVCECPGGHRINPEEFGEFHDAYVALTRTERFKAEIDRIIWDVQRPMVFVEGITDRDYLRRAIKLFGEKHELGEVIIQEVGDGRSLTRLYESLTRIESVLTQPCIVLHDPEYGGEDGRRGCVFRRKMPFVEGNPIARGVENLFGLSAIERACEHNPAFVDVHEEARSTIRGEPRVEPKRWEVNRDEKTNLCEWLCLHGSEEDLAGFEGIIRMLSSIPGLRAEESEE